MYQRADELDKRFAAIEQESTLEEQRSILIDACHSVSNNPRFGAEVRRIACQFISALLDDKRRL